MDSNDLFAFEDDFSDGLVDDLNHSYEESIHERADIPSVDDALARYSATFAQLPQTVDDVHDSGLPHARGGAVLSEDAAAADAARAEAGPRRAEDRLGAEAGPRGQPSRGQPSQAGEDQQEWLLPRERDAGAAGRPERDPRTSPARSAGSRDSPEWTQTTAEKLPRLRITPSSGPEQAPPSASYTRRAPMLSGFRPEPRARPDEPSGRQVGDPSWPDASHARPGQSSGVPLPLQQPPQQPLQQKTGLSRSRQQPTTPVHAQDKSDAVRPTQGKPSARRSSHYETAAHAEPAQRTAEAQSVHDEGTELSGAATKAARSGVHAGSARGGLLTFTFVLCAALVLAYVLRQQSVQAQEATAALESRVADLQKLIESYAAKERRHAETELAPAQERSASQAAAVDCAAAPRNLALLSEGAHILSGYTTPPSSFAWWQWSRSFRADPDCMLRAPSAECWPVHNDAAVAVGLGRAAHLQEVRLHFAALSEPFSFDAYTILAAGEIAPLEHNVSSAGFTLVNADNVTQIILRLSGFRDLCIRSIEIIGTAVAV